jgi:thiol-disulfide isomerase/thioredoxin
MRLLCAAAVSLALGLFIACADDKKPAGSKDDPKARAEKLDAVKKRFDGEFADLSKRLDRAESQAEVRGIQTEMRELIAITAEKALAIANDDPKDDTGFAAAEFLVRSAAKVGDAAGKEVGTAVGLLAEHHAANPKIKDLLVPAVQLGAGGDKLLRAVAEKGPDKDAKAVALFLRGFRIAQELEEEEDDKKLPAMVAEATDLIEKAAKESPGAKVGSTTVGEAAKEQVEALKGVLLVAVGKPAPDVESYTLDGKKAKLSDHKGNVVLLDIWATWCGPCVRMIPHERELVKRLEKKPFVLVSVSADNKKEALEQFLEKQAMPWVHWWDEGPKSQVLAKYRVRAFPTLYLIDHTGVIRHKWVGSPEADKLDKAVEDLVKQADKAKG